MDRPDYINSEDLNLTAKGLVGADQKCNTNVVDRFQYIRHMSNHLPAGIVITVLLSCLVTWLLWSHVPDYLLMPWLIFIVLSSGIHLILINTFIKNKANIGIYSQWSQYNIFLSTIVALAWGTSSLLFFPYISDSYQLLLVAIIALYAVTYIPVLSSLFLSYTSFLTALVLPLLFWTFLNPVQHKIICILALLVSYGFLILFAKNYSQVLSDSFNLAAETREKLKNLQELGEKIRIDNIQLKKKLQEHSNKYEKSRKETGHAVVTLEYIGEGVITTNIKGQVTYINPVAEIFTGWKKELAVGRDITKIFKILDESTRNKINDPSMQCIETNNTIISNESTILIRQDGLEYAIEYSATPILGKEEDISGSILAFRDVTNKRNLARDLSWQASHDPLTGLMNRREFEKQLEIIIDNNQSSGGQHALCLIDLDYFRIINYICGHQAGDTLLKKVADKLSKVAGETDTIARVGGDEFGVILHGCDMEKTSLIAAAFCKQVAEIIFTWHGKQFKPGISVGITPITDKTGDMTEILQVAEMACYRAKENGRNQFHIYNPHDQEVLDHLGEIRWVEEIQAALEKESLELFIQPVKSTDENNKKSISEILVRIKQGEDKLVTPKHFINIANLYQLMPRMDQWVIKTCFEILSRGHPMLQESAFVSINISGQSISNDNFINYVIKLTEEFQVDTNRIVMEIEENSLINNADGVKRFISIMREKGFRFALDDFNAGLKSLDNIKTLDLDYIKFDGCLSDNIKEKFVKYTAINSINRICHQLGTETIAKFITDNNSLESMREIGVDYIQGYAVSEPIPLSKDQNIIPPLNLAIPE